ncbi:MAG: hypothetical protein IMZ75_15495, partial [Actinobacteria bacterium]|nr:hypothetical protein [Actinomycetota bacterium]
MPDATECAQLRRTNHRMKLLDGRFVLALRAYATHQTLRGDTNQAGRDSEWLDADVGKAGDRTDGVV